jgi:acetylglutamate kinase
MNETIKNLFKDKETFEKKIEKIDEAIEALQELCEHKWISDGHDSHKNYKKCSICGLEDWY